MCFPREGKKTAAVNIFTVPVNPAALFAVLPVILYGRGKKGSNVLQNRSDQMWDIYPLLQKPFVAFLCLLDEESVLGVCLGAFSYGLLTHVPLTHRGQISWRGPDSTQRFREYKWSHKITWVRRWDVLIETFISVSWDIEASWKEGRPVWIRMKWRHKCYTMFVLEIQTIYEAVFHSIMLTNWLKNINCSCWAF